MPVGATRAELQGLLDIFGNVRKSEGDDFGRLADRHGETSYYFRPRGGAFSVILLWGTQGHGDPGVSVFSCARTHMTPTLELYRYVSGWQASAKFPASYVVERDGHAAVICQREFNATWLNQDDSVPQTLFSTVQMVTEISSLMRYDLSAADGGRIEDMGMNREEIAIKLCSYWDVQVERLRDLMRRSGGSGGIGY